jgi:hypothetical protein
MVGWTGRLCAVSKIWVCDRANHRDEIRDRPARKATDADLLCHTSRNRVPMSDDAFYRPNRSPVPPRPPKPGEPIWTVRVNHITWSCEFRFHGESYGWEAQLLREGALVIGHRFLLRQPADASADTERQILETEGAVTEYDREPLF